MLPSSSYIVVKNGVMFKNIQNIKLHIEIITKGKGKINETVCADWNNTLNNEKSFFL